MRVLVEKERDTRRAGSGRSFTKIAELQLDTIQEGGGFIEGSSEIGLVFHQHIVICILKSQTPKPHQKSQTSTKRGGQRRRR